MEQHNYYQDIALKDKEQWQNYRQLFSNDEINNARAISDTLSNKAMDAATFNNVAGKLTALQEQGVAFQKDRIIVSRTPPEDLNAGEVYLRIDEVID